jgi:hypothetical protein
LNRDGSRLVRDSLRMLYAGAGRTRSSRSVALGQSMTACRDLLPDRLHRCRLRSGRVCSADERERAFSNRSLGAGSSSAGTLDDAVEHGDSAGRFGWSAFVIFEADPRMPAMRRAVSASTRAPCPQCGKRASEAIPRKACSIARRRSGIAAISAAEIRRRRGLPA